MPGADHLRRLHRRCRRSSLPADGERSHGLFPGGRPAAAPGGGLRLGSRGSRFPGLLAEAPSFPILLDLRLRDVLVPGTDHSVHRRGWIGASRNRAQLSGRLLPGRRAAQQGRSVFRGAARSSFRGKADRAQNERLHTFGGSLSDHVGQPVDELLNHGSKRKGWGPARHRTNMTM